MSDIIFDTGLTESAFSKTRFSNLLSASGIAAAADTPFDPDMSFSFSEWKFDGVKTIGSGVEAHVHVCGRYGGDGEMFSLAEIFLRAERGGDAERYEAACASYAAVSVIEQAKKENVKIENIGAGGIYVKTAAGFAEKPELLFLPQAIFDASCACRGSGSYAALQGFWISKALSKPSDALSFTQAAIAYRALTKQVPFAESSESARSSDEYDKNYMRLEHVINGVDTSLAESVDASLELPSQSLQAEREKASGMADTLHAPNGQNEKPFPLAAFYKELGIGKGALNEVSHPTALPRKVFEAKVASYYKTKKRKVGALRTLRRNAKAIAVCFVVLAVIAFFVASAVRDAGRRPSAVGLTSSEVAETFYQGIRTQNVELVGAMSSGKVSKRYGDMVGGMYVVNKARSAYNPNNGIISPEAWFASLSERNADERRDVYGITSFTLDGRKADLAVDVPPRNAKRAPVTAEKNVPLADGAQTAHTADYYTVHTDGETGGFIVEHNHDTVTLTYKKNTWSITGIGETDSDVEVDTAAFISDAIGALQNAGGNAALAADALKEKYPWVPDPDAVRKAAEMNR